MLKSIKPDNVPQSFARIDPNGKHVKYNHFPSLVGNKLDTNIWAERPKVSEE